MPLVRIGNSVHAAVPGRFSRLLFFCLSAGPLVKKRHLRGKSLSCSHSASGERSIMRKAVFGLTAITCLVLGNAGLARADAQVETRAFLDKAIAARGGKDNLTTLKAFTCKLKGKLYGPTGDGIDFTGE